MFVDAIEEVGRFTRPIHTITRNYNETIVSPGAATLFFVNEDGVAVTCRHVIDLIGRRQAINDHYNRFRAEKAGIGKNNKYNQRLKLLEETYQYKPETIIQLKELFVGVTSDPSSSYRWINHPVYDLAILIFDNLQNRTYQSYARFLKDSTQLKQGKFLCRLGFPFPEFTNYQFNPESDD